MHFGFLFALHKSLSGVGVSIGVLGGTWKHLGSKREWKVLFERVEHQSGQWERPTTPAPDERRQRDILQRGSAPALSDASWSTNFEAGAGSGSDLGNPRAI
ncbi:hypothetical protein F2Q68_00045006 [Brassica cretica]|uniref:Uncharacterized protein n=1 Tax=Brassica cretica TaxID=69181 RepID=A0A8S9LRQ0_BRACR|nr:hypothetical protein F2Q68_00045006 [Brassica cretica]